MDLSKIIQEKVAFDRSIHGTLGSFHTSSSFDVNYILTGINYKELDWLEVASEAFDFNQVNFEEMVQREIDEKRVNEEIVGDYLENGAGRALFFPPLIVSVVAFDEENNPIHKYESSKEEIKEINGSETFIKTWDKFFSIEAIKVNDGFDQYKTEDNGNIKIFKHYTKLKFDSKQVKLIVIDGQHRYKALKEYISRYDNQKNFLNIPICICFSPKALSSNLGDDILDNLRNMFVTINNTGKQVSGHYIDLLNDRSLASHAVRSLANMWKSSNNNPLHSKLQFLEWNQRSDSKSRRVNRAHSITTVSMLCESLRKSIFDSNKNNLYKILNLPKNKEELERNSDIHISEISDDNFSINQKKTLYEIIDNEIIPHIETLLTKPSVYNEKINSFFSSISKFEAQAENNTIGYRAFINKMKQFSDIDKGTHFEESKVVSEKFYKSIPSRDHHDNFSRLVFNQAYFRLWADIVSAHEIFNQEREKFTESFIEALEVIAFDENKDIFSRLRKYNQLTLYKANKPNTTLSGKDFWLEILASSLVNETSKRIFKNFLIPFEKSQEAECILLEIIENHLNSFMKRSFSEIHKDNLSNWKIKDFPIETKQELEAAEKNGSKEDISKILNRATREEIEIRINLLSNTLNIEINADEYISL